MSSKRKKQKYKSKFEAKVAANLPSGWVYEPSRIPYVKKHKYVPDFESKEYDFIVEAKGRFTGTDRTKHLALREQHPEIEVRFIFMRDNYLSKKSKTRYSDWCDKHNFIYVVSKEGKVPQKWLSKVSKTK